MEFPEHPGGMHQPELEPNRPARLFTYAHDSEVWLRERLSKHLLPEAIDQLAHALVQYASRMVDIMPALAIVSADISHTQGITAQGSRRTIESAPLPLEGDAA